MMDTNDCQNDGPDVDRGRDIDADTDTDGQTTMKTKKQKNQRKCIPEDEEGGEMGVK